MSVQLFWKQKEILHVKNVVFGFLYDCMFEIIENEGIDLNKNMEALIDQLYVGGYGIGCDLADYVNNKDDLAAFIVLLQKSIRLLEQKIPGLPTQTREPLWGFHSALAKEEASLDKIKVNYGSDD